MFLNRREFHRLGLLTAAGFALPRFGMAGGFSTAGQAAPGLPKPVTLAPYVDPLPIPPVLPAGKMPGGPVTVRMAPFRQKVHRDLPPTTLWGYNGSWPGPTIEVHRDQPFSVQWVNALPTRHFLPLDFTIHGAEETVPPVRAVVHVHGAQTLPEHDGYPDAWSTSDGKTGAFYKPGPNHFPNSQPACTLSLTVPGRAVSATSSPGPPKVAWPSTDWSVTGRPTRYAGRTASEPASSSAIPARPSTPTPRR